MWFSSILLLLLALTPGLAGQVPVDGAVDRPVAAVQPDRIETGRIQNGGSQGEWILVDGEVEIDRVEALVSAEQKVRQALWERFAPVWKRQAGFAVPEERVEEDLQEWLARDFERLAPIQAMPVQVFRSSVGEAYRKSYRVQLAGEKAEAFRRAGEHRATALSSRFHKSFLLMALLITALCVGASRMDRLTRGYLTWRIRFVSLVLVGMGIFLIYPHS
jgi:hypothetical protein